MNEIRIIRNSFLSQTDKYLINDFPLTIEKKNIIINYRQYLRDLPETLKNVDIDPNNIGSYFQEPPVKLINPILN